MAAKVKDRETADGKRLRQAIEELNGLQVRIGIQEGEKYEDGTSVLDVAMWNELGTYNVPARPFIRDSVDAHASEVNADLERVAKKLVMGDSVENALNDLGERQTRRMVEEINTGNFAPNEDITVNGGWMRNKKSGKSFYVKGKNSEHPLIDSSKLRQSIHHVIVKKGESD